MINEINCFVNWVRRRNPKAHTWQDYCCDLKHFADFVGEQDLENISYQDIDNFIAAQAARGLKATTINRRLAAIQSLYTFLSVENPDLVCPVLPHRHTLRVRRRLPRAVQEEDLHRFFSVINDVRDQAIFLLMLRCGLRISEVSNLTLRDLYLTESPPRLLVSGKNGKERSAYLSLQVNYALRRYLTKRPITESEAVFLNYKGQGIATIGIQKRLEKYRKEASIHLTAHQLRHNFANDLVLADVPVTSIQKLMGHAWIATTQIYIAANDPKVKQDFYLAAKQLEGWG